MGITMTEERRAPEILEEGAATFRVRNAAYGDTYLQLGAILQAFFPDGLPDLKTADDWNRFSLWLAALLKLQRYSNNLHRGGHKDSAHDAMVYSAMLEEVTK
jgi:hypothetical protein